MGRVPARYTLSMLYDMRFKIFNHLDPTMRRNRPLAAVGFHESEDALKDSLLEDTIMRYTENSIFEVFHLTLNDYLQNPIAINLLLDQRAREIITKRHASLNAGIAAAAENPGKK